jgi:hypothetical protein
MRKADKGQRRKTGDRGRETRDEDVRQEKEKGRQGTKT